MSSTVQSYLRAKYGSGGPGASRFEPVEEEVHSSQLSDCQRKRKWKFERGSKSEPSPYFELGRVFELLYGAALAYEHDPDITSETLKSNQPWDVAEMSTRVVQDVNIRVELPGGGLIVGEADWVVFAPGCPGVDRVNEYGPVDLVEVAADGSRAVVFDHGDGMEYDPDWTVKVVETKTKKNLDWVDKKGPDEKHVYQVYPYMHALDTRGELAYMQRNDWEERVIELEYDDDRWLDSMMRAQQHVSNQSAGPDEVPPTTPLDKSECRWCSFSSECRDVGGTRWDQ
jgi:hypothetical protein